MVEMLCTLKENHIFSPVGNKKAIKKSFWCKKYSNILNSQKLPCSLVKSSAMQPKTSGFQQSLAVLLHKTSSSGWFGLVSFQMLFIKKFLSSMTVRACAHACHV